MAWRRYAATSVGVVGGGSLVFLQRDSRTCTPVVKTADAFCPCSTTALLCAAASTGVAAKLFYSYCERVLIEQGITLLQHMAEEGDHDARFAIACMILQSGGVEMAKPHMVRCLNSPDCAAFCALQYTDIPEAQRNEMLISAKEQIANDLKMYAQALGDETSYLPPTPPGARSEDMDEDDRTIMQHVSQEYIRQTVSDTAARLLDSDFAALSDEARDAALFVCASRGITSFYGLLAQEAFAKGDMKHADEYSLAMLRPTANPALTAHLKELFISAIQNPSFPEEVRAPFANEMIAWWVLQHSAATVNLCTMRAQGHPMEETMTDEEATSAMESFSTTFQALEPRLHQMCPPEVVALSQRVFHQCTQAPANVNDTHELELCSEGLSIMTDALFKHATSLVRREDVVSV